MRHLLKDQKYRYWYAEQNQALKKFCRRNKYDFNTFCDVLALTSPRVQLLRNFKLTLDYMNRRKFYSNILPNIQLSINHYEQTGEIRGLKTSAFALALKGNQNAVVLDIYMSLVLGVDQSVFATKSGYLWASKRIIRLANKLDWTPTEVQACLWCNYLISVNRQVYNYVDLIKKM